MRDPWLYVFIVSFIVGVALQSVTGVSIFFAYFLLLLGAVLFVSYVLVYHRAILLVALAFVALGLGDIRSDYTNRFQGDALLDAYVGGRVVLQGTIIQEPDEREASTRLVVTLEKAEDVEVKSNALIITDRFPRYSYGDRVSITGRLDLPENFTTDRGREFDYISFLKKDDIFYTLLFPEVELVGSGHGHPVKSALLSLKRAFLNRIALVIPEPEASLLGGLVVGAKESLGDDIQDKFRKTGIIHIVVLSGYNVTIVADAIMKFFSFLPRFAGFGLGALSIVFFAIMTGASATIVRASIMALLVILAKVINRKYFITRALALTAFGMVLHNPQIVLFDPSFQLSFLATLGLIYLAPHVEKKLGFIPTKWQFREFATATIATQIFVLPLLLFMTGEVSLVALPVNLLILGAVPITMLFGFITGLIAFVSTTLVTPIAFLTQVLLSYMFLVVDFFASIPFASVGVPLFPIWATIMLYMLYGFGLWWFWKRETPKSY